MTPCSLCHAPVGPRALDAGGDLGLVHARCFRAFDSRSEAVEVAMVLALAEAGIVTGSRCRRGGPAGRAAGECAYCGEVHLLINGVACRRCYDRERKRALREGAERRAA